MKMSQYPRKWRMKKGKLLVSDATSAKHNKKRKTSMFNSFAFIIFNVPFSVRLKLHLK